MSTHSHLSTITCSKCCVPVVRVNASETVVAVATSALIGGLIGSTFGIARAGSGIAGAVPGAIICGAVTLAVSRLFGRCPCCNARFLI